MLILGAALSILLLFNLPSLALGLVQRILDESQHELLLGELVSGAGGFPLQVCLDALEKGFSDLEGHRPGFFVRHDLITSIFFHFEVFGQQVGDVLRGGEARLFPGFRDFLMQVEPNLSTEVLCGCHGVDPLSFDCDPSILERHGESYYQHHQ